MLIEKSPVEEMRLELQCWMPWKKEEIAKLDSKTMMEEYFSLLSCFRKELLYKYMKQIFRAKTTKERIEIAEAYKSLLGKIGALK